MSEKNYRLLLEYILERIDDIEALTDVEYDAFTADNAKHARAAVLYYLQTMSETTQRLPDALKKQQSHIDWVGISGFRNRIVHGYLNINSRLVWQVIKNELPELKSAIKALLLVVDDFNDT